MPHVVPEFCIQSVGLATSSKQKALVVLGMHEMKVLYDTCCTERGKSWKRAATIFMMAVSEQQATYTSFLHNSPALFHLDYKVVVLVWL